MKYVIRILKLFERISGLAIDNEKTKVVKIEASRGRSIPWQGMYGFKWTNSFKISGILYNANNMEEISKFFRKVKKRKLKNELFGS